MPPFLSANLFNYTRCERADGSAYGTAGQCRKGTESTKVRPEGELYAQQDEKKRLDYLLTKRYEDNPERKEKLLKRYTQNEKLANFLREKDDGSTEIVSNHMNVVMKRRLNNFDEVSLEFNGRDVSFTANDKFDYGTIEDRKDRVKAVLEVRRMFRDLTSTLKPGTVIKAVAYEDDGRGEQRTKAYERIGFARTSGGVLAAVIAPGGSLTPYEASFSESSDSLVDWYIVLFGHSPTESYNEYDFTRCVRPDGSAYGTAGQCRKGVAVEITRIETGLFAVRDSEGRNIGMIQSPKAFAGGGGIREKGVSAAYDVRLTTPDGQTHKVDNIPTLAAAKAKVRELMGEKGKGGDAKAIAQGGLTKKGKASRIRNLQQDVEEVKDDFNSAREKFLQRKKQVGEEAVKSDRTAIELFRRAKFLKDKLSSLTEELKQLKQTPEVD